MRSTLLLLLAAASAPARSADARPFTGAGPVAGGEGFLPPTVPPWPPTFDLSRSTITMQCNSSGYSSPRRGAQFGIVSYDWSNAKAQWARAGPMDCEERLARQADMTKGVDSDARVFVYRNVVKALPWFSAVREKLGDPLYSGFFLRFDPARGGTDDGGGGYAVNPCAPEDPSKCSRLYHDAEQTPEVPTPSDPNPDGSCDPARGCDCGPAVPCGEYLFDHRNGTMLEEWLIREVALGPTALGRPSVDGLFLDDYWCSDLICEEVPSAPGCPCDDPVQGATETNRYAVRDMGLSDEDVRDIALGWNRTMGRIERAILDAGGYTWWLMEGQENADATPEILSRRTCARQLRRHCSVPPERKAPSLFGLAVNGTATTQPEQDVAFFLLARGPYAWIGWGVWGMTWPFDAEPAHGRLPPMPHGVPLPGELERDFGLPLEGTCRETGGGGGVFVRRWTSDVIALDCNEFKATLPTALPSHFDDFHLSQ